MKMKFAITTLFAAIAGLAPAALPAEAGTTAAKKDWSTTVTRTESGSHILGNPDAPTKVTEYMSYTCPHCAHFETTDAPILKNKYVAGGKVSFEIRNMLLNAVDLSVAMVARCGGKEKFFGNHKALLAAQQVWIAKAGSISEETRAKLAAGDAPGYMLGVYKELDLAGIMTPRGVTPDIIATCLADQQAFDQIIAMTKDGGSRGVNSTPSFLVNEKLAQNVHTLDTLAPLIGQ